VAYNDKGLVCCHTGTVFTHSRLLTAKTTLMLSDVMVSRIEYFNRKHFLHRYIKPDYFVFDAATDITKY
jgi:hypothetical protein